MPRGSLLKTSQLTANGRIWYSIDIMLHRHIIETDCPSLAAIDDTIDRGNRVDWIRLKKTADADDSVRQKILRVCAAKVADPYAQRYHLWNYYARHATA